MNKFKEKSSELSVMKAKYLASPLDFSAKQGEQNEN